MPSPTPLVVKKGSKMCGLYLRRNAGAVVGNLNYDTTVLAIGSNAKLAFAAHGVNRIVDEVGPHLIEFAAEGIHQKRNASGSRAAPPLRASACGS